VSTSTATASTAPASSGVTYKASFTHYGSGDSFGSPNCQTDTAACGFFTSPGFSAAVSQNLYGVGPGAGAGPACGTCWKLVGETDSSGNTLSNAGTSIVVMGKSAISFLQIPANRGRDRQRPPIHFLHQNGLDEPPCRLNIHLSNT
jgi:hypothetical protein